MRVALWLRVKVRTVAMCMQGTLAYMGSVLPMSPLPTIGSCGPASHPTPGPSQADLLVLQHASARLKAVAPLGDDEVDALVMDFQAERKAAPRGKQR